MDNELLTLVRYQYTSYSIQRNHNSELNLNFLNKNCNFTENKSFDITTK